MSPTPFAIPISFTANYPLEVCKLILLNSQYIPTGWRKIFNAPQTTFYLDPITPDTYKLQAEKIFGRGAKVIAQGSLEKLDDQATTVTGYADATSSFYITLVLLFIIGIPTSMFFFSNSTATISFKLGFAILFFGGAVILNVLLMRHEATKLARTIEEILRRPANPSIY